MQLFFCPHSADRIMRRTKEQGFITRIRSEPFQCFKINRITAAVFLQRARGNIPPLQAYCPKKRIIHRRQQNNAVSRFGKSPNRIKNCRYDAPSRNNPIRLNRPIMPRFHPILHRLFICNSRSRIAQHGAVKIAL